MVCMIIIIIKFPCEIIILQIYDRNKYYIIEVPDTFYVLREHNNCLDDNNLIKYCNESLLAVILECLSMFFF